MRYNELGVIEQRNVQSNIMLALNRFEIDAHILPWALSSLNPIVCAGVCRYIKDLHTLIGVLLLRSGKDARLGDSWVRIPTKRPVLYFAPELMSLLCSELYTHAELSPAPKPNEGSCAEFYVTFTRGARITATVFFLCAEGHTEGTYLIRERDYIPVKDKT